MSSAQQSLTSRKRWCKMHRCNALILGRLPPFSKIELTSLRREITSFTTEGAGPKSGFCFSKWEIRFSREFTDVCNSSRDFSTCVATLYKRFCSTWADDIRIKRRSFLRQWGHQRGWNRGNLLCRSSVTLRGTSGVVRRRRRPRNKRWPRATNGRVSRDGCRS